jgi:hypothetical protein
LWLEASLGRKLVGFHLTRKAGHGGGACQPSFEGGISRRVAVQTDLSKNTRPYLKNN